MFGQSTYSELPKLPVRQNTLPLFHLLSTSPVAYPKQVTQLRLGISLITTLLSLTAFTSTAHAWEHHATLSPWILKSLPPEVAAQLGVTGPAPCPTDDQAHYDKLTHDLALKPGLVITPTHPASASSCGPFGALNGSRPQISAQLVLSGPFVDDPDNGMDRDLPDSADPRGERALMGGSQGPTSQGFRHMYFGGWKWEHPIVTFQVPFHAVGQAPERAQLVAETARALIRSGDVVWGSRVLAWALHYIQDLSQPFHSVQVPDLSMVPWFALMEWPPGKAFGALVKETTRTIGNYHWAFEGYTELRIQEDTTNPYLECLDKPKDYAKLRIDRSETPEPKTLALAVAEGSVAIAPEVGEATVDFFGSHLKSREYDLANERGKINYADMAVRPDKVRERHRLHEVTCRALANGILASQKLIEWAFRK